MVKTLDDRLEEMDQRCVELEKLLAAPDVIADLPRYTVLVREHGSLAKIVSKYRQLKPLIAQKEEAENILREESDRELRHMARQEMEDLSGQEADLRAELENILLGSDDTGDRNAIVEIRAGTGGEEAALFAADLFRMYLRYAEKRNFRTQLLHSSPTDLGGFKEAIFVVEGKEAYRCLQFERGGHRVQRVPETESGGRIHTSLVTVAVLPEVEDVEVKINPEDLQVDFYRASGPGGQKVNKTSSAVRITHEPTGIVVQCQESPSQQKNRAQAMRVLRSRIHEHLERQRREKRDELRRSQIGSGDRSQRIRTYNFPQNRVTDHRINRTLYNLGGFMLGDMQELLDALLEHDLAERKKNVSAG